MPNFVRKITKNIFALLIISTYSTAHAALLDVTTLTVSNASVNMSISGVSADLSTALIPPAKIIMGTYQDPIASYSTSFTGGTFDGTIYSSDAGGTLAAPSATVDTSMGTFSSVDLGSLRLKGVFTEILGSYSFDTELWPITTEPSLTSYNATTGDFSLSWSFVSAIEMVVIDGVFPGDPMTTGTFDIVLSGQASVVPLPASAWLFTAGLISLAGFVKRKRKHAA